MKVSLIALGVGGVALLLLAAAGPAYQLGILALTSAFGVLRWAAYVGIVTIIMALAAAAFAYWRGPRLALAVAALALVLGIVSVAIPFRWQRAAQSAPPIHDVSTDLENPPVFKAIVALRQDAPNSLERAPDLAQQQRKGYPDIQPITLPVPRDQVFEEVIEQMQESDWQIADADKDTGIIEATDTTPWFGFKDDIVVRLTPWGAGTRVDVRSVSRIGRSDVGTNAKRVRAFLDALRK